jgi:histidine triad (HIT) family protein
MSTENQAPSDDTIFGKIIRREIPAHVVYEDDDTLAFLDITPNSPGHTLVIPKKFARNIFDIDDETLCAVMKTGRKIAPAIREAVGAEGMNVNSNNGAAAGQIVFHFHIHLIPRFTDDHQDFKHKEYASGEAEEVLAKIHAAIQNI